MIDYLTDNVFNFLQILVFIGTIIVIYQKDRKKSEVDNATQSKDIESLRNSCTMCKDDNSKQFEQFETRIRKIEDKQSSDTKGIYDRLDAMEQRLGKRIDDRIDTTTTLLLKILKIEK